MVLKEHIQKINAKEISDHYLRNMIQNEIIALMAKHVKANIVREIKSAKYFSIMVDCTPDVSHTEQLSLIVRYVHIEEKTVTIKERFMGFDTLDKQVAESYKNAVIGILNEYSLDINCLHGQSYDNASAMAGKYNGLQKKILEINPNAHFCNCACHCLNLLLSDCANCCCKFKTYFGTLQSLYAFLSGSTQRWSILLQFVTIVCKRQPETRWEGKIDAVKAIRLETPRLLNAIKKILETTTVKPQAAAEIKGVAKTMATFDFVLTTVIWYEVLSQINFVSKSLQAVNMQIDVTVDKLDGLHQWIKSYRQTGFNEALKTAEDLSRQWSRKLDVEIPSSFAASTSGRRRTITSFFDKETRDDPIICPKKKYEVECFNVMVDLFIREIRTRFVNHKKFQSDYGFLFEIMSNEDEIKDMPISKLKEECDNIAKVVGGNLVSSEDLNQEIIFFCNLPNKDKVISDLKAKEKSYDLSKTGFGALTYIVRSESIDSYPNLFMSLQIMLTLPITIGTAERSFSKLKLIKTYLRSTMTQNRLSNLTILSIEHEESQKLDIDSLIDEFAVIKARKQRFL